MLKLNILLIITILFDFTILAGNTISGISGNITDIASGHPIENVNVFLLNTNYGAATDKNGHFIISDVPDGQYTLLVSAIGFEEIAQEIKTPYTTTLELQLEETFFQMNAVVVTGTRTGKIHQNVPIATEVISRQDINDSGARDLGELLDQRAGVSVSTSVEGGTIVNLLGMDSKYILVLVDGQPMVGKFNNRNSLDQISTAIIDKVEIIKGPSSSLYGSEAMGGVINIITQRKLSAKPLSVYTRFSGENNSFNPFNRNLGKRNLRFNFFQPWKSLKIQIDFDYLDVNVDKSIKYIDVDWYNKLSFRNGIVWPINDHHLLKIHGSFFSNLEKSKTQLMIANTDIKKATYYLDYSWILNPNWNFTTLVRTDLYSRNYIQKRPWGVEIKNEKTNEVQNELEISTTYISENRTVNLGAEIWQDIFYNKRVSGGERELNRMGYYFQLDQKITPWLTMVSGARLDDNNEISPVISPRVAAMISIKERWKFRGSWGTGFRMPSFMDKYIDWNHQQFGYQIIGNPNLKPEESNGFSVGVEYYHPREYLVSVILYRNIFSHMIVDSLMAPGQFTYINIDKVSYRGLELQARWNLSSEWLASWGYNFTDNRNLMTGEPVPNIPVHSANVRFSYKHPKGWMSSALKIKLTGSYTVDEFIVDSQTLNLNKRSAFLLVDYDGKFRINKKFTIAYGVKNFLDKTDQSFGPFVGRTFYMEIETKLKGINQ